MDGFTRIRQLKNKKVFFLFFFLILTTALWLLAFVAITGSVVICQVRTKYAAIALGALIGARLADTLVSHWLLHTLRYRPNPGLWSTPFYVFEAGLLIVTFQKGLIARSGFACLGLGIGTLAFCIVLPSLQSLRIVKSWRKNRWRSGAPLPTWVHNP